MPKFDPRQNGKAARLQRSAARLRRLADRIRPDSDAAPVHEHRRRTLSGRTVPFSVERRTWLDIVAKPAVHNRVSGGSRVDHSHPSRKHDVPVPDREFVVSNPPGVPRRERRAKARAVAADNAAQARASRPRLVLPVESPGPSRAVRRWADSTTELLDVWGQVKDDEAAEVVADHRAMLADVRRSHENGLGEHLDKAAARQMAREAAARPVLYDEPQAFTGHAASRLGAVR